MEYVTGIATILGQIITWVLVIYGWKVVDSANDKRESRKEVRAMILEIHKLLDEIEKNAIEYHTGDNPSPNLSADLKRNISRKLQVCISHLGKRNLDVTKPEKALTALRQAITLKNFDSKDFSKKRLSDPLILNIGTTKDSLAMFLEDSFNSKFF